MDSNRIKEIQEGTAYPKSVSVYQALHQVWNECGQEQSDQLTQLKVENERLKDELFFHRLLIAVLIVFLIFYNNSQLTHKER